MSTNVAASSILRLSGVLVLELRALGRHEAEHDCLARGDEPQRLEVA